jgi:IclR family KDG regulon transcriptional repressor
MERELMKSLNKAFEILKLFLDNNNEMTLADISKLSGLPKTTTSRIVSALVKNNYLQQQEKRGKYSLGTIYLSYSGVIKKSLRLRNIAMPHLVNLSRIAHEAVVIAFRDGSGNIFTETFYDMSQQNNIIRIGPDESYGMPLNSTCLGKIILAEMSDEELKYYFNRKNLVSNTPNAIINFNKMEQHLRIVRQEGVAFDDEEFSLGVRGVGSGIRNGEGMLVGAAGIVAPSIRLSRSRMRKLVPDVKNCNIKISKELGFIGE